MHNIYRVSSLAFETLLFVLTLVKFSQSVARSFREQSIVGIFVRDGTWAFALIFGEWVACARSYPRGVADSEAVVVHSGNAPKFIDV